MSSSLPKLVRAILLSIFSAIFVFIYLTDVKRNSDSLRISSSVPHFHRRFSRSLDSFKSEQEPNVVVVKKVVPSPKSLAQNLVLGDIFIAVKTSRKFHQSRLSVVLDTWANIALEQTYYFTDDSDEELERRTGNRVINTNCSPGHTRQALCCKMGIELDVFIKSNKKWFCHVDDDVYVNVNRLLETLRTFDETEDWYLGKPSLTNPMTVRTTRSGSAQKFWFATGGAGFCISRTLAEKMSPVTSGGGLVNVCDRIRLPDDCSIGYIINHILKVELRVLHSLHSHLEPLHLVTTDNLPSQITLSYSNDGTTTESNIVDVPGFSMREDPTRFYSVHCRLYGGLSRCASVGR